MRIAQSLCAVRERVHAATKRSGREAGCVQIVAAVKTIGVPQIAEAVEAGMTDLGENSAKELAAKAEALGGGLRWHYLGALQTNKVRFLDRVDLIHSLDREREAAALQRRGESSGRTWDVLIEVNLSAEATKDGVPPGELVDLLDAITAYPLVRPRGFMFMAPQVQNPEDVRWLFAEGRRLRDRFSAYGLDELSMGMTDDFEVAIEEGATIVRIGRAIFGDREV